MVPVIVSVTSAAEYLPGAGFIVVSGHGGDVRQELEVEVEREYGGYAARQVQVFCRYLYAQQAKRTERGVVCEQQPRERL